MEITTIIIDTYNAYKAKLPIRQWTDEGMQDCKPGPCLGGTDFIFIRETTIANQPAVKTAHGVSTGTFSAETEITYFIPYKQTIYSLTLDKENSGTDNFDEGTDELVRIYQTMLGSFKLSK